MLIIEESNLDFLWQPYFMKNEEHRVYYVAISRARERLFINVPQLSDTTTKKLKGVFKIITV